MTTVTGKRSILAVDDDITVLTATRNMLSATYEVSLAKSADMAMTILKSTRIDLILLDVEMPGMSGLAFMEYLHSQPDYYHIPVIFVTSHGRQDIILHAAKAGAKDFIVKPIVPKVLMDKCSAVLKVVQEPVSRQTLISSLRILENAARREESLRTEQLTDDLTRYRYSPDIDNKLAELRKAARQFEYANVAEKALQAIDLLKLDADGDDDMEEDEDPLEELFH